ncbi:MAG: histidine phosphatase family protein [Acidimicrobiia bacterium]
MSAPISSNPAADATAAPFVSLFDIAFLTNTEDVTELVLVRHGEQEADRVGGNVGSLIDPPLSARGQLQAELVGRRLAGERIDVVYASPLARAYDTGNAIAGHHGLEPRVIEALEEIKLWNTAPPDKTVLELLGPVLSAGMRARMVAERKWDAYPYSEGSDVFRGRVVMAIDGIAANHPGERVVIACHGGVINAYLAHHLGITADMWFRPAHTAVNVVFAKGPTRSLRSINDVRHLEHDAALITH